MYQSCLVRSGIVDSDWQGLSKIIGRERALLIPALCDSLTGDKSGCFCIQNRYLTSPNHSSKACAPLRTIISMPDATHQTPTADAEIPRIRAATGPIQNPSKGVVKIVSYCQAVKITEVWSCKKERYKETSEVTESGYIYGQNVLTSRTSWSSFQI